MRVDCQIQVLVAVFWLGDAYRVVAFRTEALHVAGSSLQGDMNDASLENATRDYQACCCRTGECQEKHRGEWQKYFQYRTSYGSYCCRKRDQCVWWNWSGKEAEELIQKGILTKEDACSSPTCPENMGLVLFEDKQECVCLQGYSGRASYLWDTSRWEGSCEVAQCPDGAEGHPDCECKEGYSGKVKWDYDTQSWLGKCTSVRCPEGASGFPKCACPTEGYKSELEWDAKRSAWRGACARVHCPWPATEHPSCACPSDYEGKVVWNAELEAYDGHCTPTWARKIPAGVHKSCDSMGLSPILDKATCKLAADALGLRHRGVEVTSSSVPKPKGCYLQLHRLRLNTLGALPSASFSDIFANSKQWANDMEPICKTKSAKRSCEWGIFGGSTPKFNDVAQGQLGTCYFLAAASSIAHFHPHVIEEMIPRVKSWDAGVYTTRWFLNGRPLNVSVDEMIPVAPSGSPVFVNYNHGHHFWPIVLEKAWAKIFSSFSNVDRGTPQEALMAMTQAPIRHYAIEDEESTWKMLRKCATEAFPAVASSKTQKAILGSGIVKGHGFTFLDAKELASGKKVVQLYSPWSYTEYDGSLVDLKREDGSFFMSLSEFVESIQGMTIAEMRAGYKTSSVALEHEASKLEATVEFEMTGNDPFVLSLVWPNDRLLTHEESERCGRAFPAVSLEVEFEPQGKSRDQHYQHFDIVLHDQAWSEMTGGAGNYRVKVTADFGAVTWVHKVQLGTYARESPEFRITSTTSLGNRANVTSSARTCRSSVNRLEHLATIDGRDDFFPPELSSIAPPGALCGDAARAEDKVDCESYNRWRNFSQVACPGVDGEFVDLTDKLSDAFGRGTPAASLAKVGLRTLGL